MKHIENQVDENPIRLEYKRKFAIKVEKLKRWRKELRISQTLLASFCGCSLRKIQMFENNKSLDGCLLYGYNKYLESNRD